MEEEVKNWKPEYFSDRAIKARRLLRRASGLPDVTPLHRAKLGTGKAKAKTAAAATA